MVWKNFRQQTSKQAQQGQAIMEFLLGLLMVISFFFFYVKLAAVFAIGNYIHYATFMSARAYVSSAASEADQKSNAQAVIESMLVGRWKHLLQPKEGNEVKGLTIGQGNFYGDDPYGNYWNQGVTYHFQSKLSLYPWNRNQGAPPILLDLTSESWLGREQSTDECKGKTKAKIKTLIRDADIYWENGNEGC